MSTPEGKIFICEDCFDPSFMTWDKRADPPAVERECAQCGKFTILGGVLASPKHALRYLLNRLSAEIKRKSN